MDGFHLPTQSWSSRAPSPPRVLVPPPDTDRKGKLVFPVIPSQNVDFESSGFANSDFLKTVTYDNFNAGNAFVEWKYAQRWTAQNILPFLFLGPVTAARSRDFLLGNGITMVLAVRNTKSAHARLLGSKAAEELDIPYSTVDTTGNQELIAAFPRGIEIINAHLSEMYQQCQDKSYSMKKSTPGKVLVFCESGNERSAAMVVAYIMAMYSMDVINAIQIVQAQRFAVAFDDPTRLLLQTYDSILSARRDVYRSGKQNRTASDGANSAGLAVQSPQIMSRKPSKRTLDDTYDHDEMEVDGGEVFNEKDKRIGAAPFRDDAEW